MVKYDELRLVPYVPPPDWLLKNPQPGWVTPKHRKLPGPRYRLAAVREDFAIPEKIWLITTDCHNDVTLSLRWTTTEVSDLLCALEDAHYRDSEWCLTGNGLAIDCDSYVVTVDTKTIEISPTGTQLYVKFGFRYPTHNFLLMVSCHPS
jgi:hypothetical protein